MKLGWLQAQVPSFTGKTFWNRGEIREKKLRLFNFNV